MKLLNMYATALLCCTLSNVSAQKYAGGDISLLPTYEERGAKYFTHEGEPITNVLDYLKDQGWNAQRVRLFVDPNNASDEAKEQGVRQDLAYILKLAKRIKEAGFALILDFHYSDTWADPNNQWTPDDWKNLNNVQLGEKLYSYTKDVLEQLVAEGATPDFIQTGNEISYGMDWGTSALDAKYCYPSNQYTSNWTRFNSLLQKATAACREVCPNAKIILHTERVSSNTDLQKDNSNYNALTYFCNNMKDNAIDYDIIGLSYYPYYHGDLSQLEGAIKKIENYNKDIMLVETGYPSQWPVSDAYDYTKTFPYTDAGQKAYTDSLVTMLNKYDKVIGLFWWFPEANEYNIDWATNHVTKEWYHATLFNNQDGKAFSAISSLKNFISDPTGIINVNMDNKISTDNSWYTLQGIKLQGEPLQKGFYIYQGKKIIKR